MSQGYVRLVEGISVIVSEWTPVPGSSTPVPGGVG